MVFPVSGVEVAPWVPPLVALVVSAFTSMGGVSGAFLLLPFQVSALGFASPAVSSTNLVYNVVAIPGGVWRYLRERRMVWPLAWSIVAGSLPGVCVGALVRIRYLPDPRAFKFFVGWVLLYIGGRLVLGLPAREYSRGGAEPAEFVVRHEPCTWRRIAYSFAGQTFSLSTLRLWPLVFVMGVVSGAYGVGGGAIVGPLLVALFRLPVHTIAGAVLTSTFVTSVAGVVFYWVVARCYAGAGPAVAPDWLLGGLFGLGGLVGTYVGARCQKYVPAAIIELMLATVLLLLATRYIGGFFW